MILGFVILLVLAGTVPSRALALANDDVILTIQADISRNQLPEAKAKLASALDRDPDNGGLYNLRGIIEAQEGNFDAARADFSTAVKLSPKLVSAYLNLGRIYQMRSDTQPPELQKAIHTYEQALRIDPSQQEARRKLAMLFEWQGDFAKSLAHLQKLPEAEASRSAALSIRCADLAGLGRKNEARAAAKLLLNSADLSEADVLATLPVLEAKNLDEITRELIEGLAQRSLATARSLEHLAATYERLHQLTLCRKTWERIAIQKPNDSKSLLALARIAYKQQDRLAALGYLAHARDLEPENALVHFVFGLISWELQVPIEAKSSVGKALSLKPDDYLINYAMGILTLQGGNAGDAASYFRKLIELNKVDPRGPYGLGIAYYYMKEYEQARVELRSVTTDPVNGAGAHYFLGRIARIERNLEEAASELNLAIQAKADYAEAYAELALVHIRTKEYEAARRNLDRAMQVDPDGFLANANLLILYQTTKDPRSEAQAERLRELEKKRSELQELSYRTIRINPY